MRSLAPLFKALGDPARLGMFALLVEHGALCVCDLEAALGVTQSRASRHLSALSRAGLVEAERRGMWVHYRVVGDGDPARAGLVALVRSICGGDRRALLERRLAAWLREKARDQRQCGEAGRRSAPARRTKGAR